MDPRLAGIKARVRYVKDEDLRGLPSLPSLSQPFFEDPELAKYFGLYDFPGARAHYVAAQLDREGISIGEVYRSMVADKAALKKLPR